MGLDYSFVFIVPHDDIDELLLSLARHLVPADRQRLIDALPWAPVMHESSKWVGEGCWGDQRGIAGLAKREHETGHDYCFSLLVEPDDEIRTFEHIRGPLPPASNGFVRFGCVWTDIEAQSRWAVMRCTAATSAMSRLLLTSPHLQGLARDIGTCGQATAVFLDVEASDAWLLITDHGLLEVPMPDWETYRSRSPSHLTLDAFVAEALRLSSRNRQ